MFAVRLNVLNYSVHPDITIVTECVCYFEPLI